MKYKSVKTKKYFSTLLLFLSLSFFAAVQNASASVYSEVDGTIHGKDVFSVGVFFDSEGKNTNVIEGSIKLETKNKSEIKIKDISVANSVVSIWPRKPSLSLVDKTITFTGASLKGFSGNHSLLFTVFIEIDNPDILNVVDSGVVGYMNDGSGESVSYKNVENNFSITSPSSSVSDAEFTVVSRDNEPPLPFAIELMQDPSLNNGMKFLSFETTDSGSGIDRYEVTEGNNKPVITGSSYVPVNQSDIKNITVAAYDKAGNVRLETYNAVSNSSKVKWFFLVTFLISLIVIIGASVHLFKKHEIYKKNKQ